MSISIATPVSFQDKHGKSVNTFGILDAAKPYDAEGRANGICVGVAKLRLLADQLATRPADLLAEINAWLSVHAQPAPIAVADESKPALRASITLNAVPDRPKQAPLRPAPVDRLAMPTAPTPKPVKATAPAYVPAPLVVPPADTPIKMGTYNRKRYGMFADGLKVYQNVQGRVPFFKKAQITPDMVTWDSPTVAAIRSNPPVHITPPAPTPAPTKTILREIIDGETIVVLYLDGTYALHNMAFSEV